MFICLLWKKKVDVKAFEGLVCRAFQKGNEDGQRRKRPALTIYSVESRSLGMEQTRKGCALLNGEGGSVLFPLLPPHFSQSNRHTNYHILERQSSIGIVTLFNFNGFR